MKGDGIVTVPSDVNKHIYAGNGVTRVWPYTFLLYDASHLQVWVKRGDEESALLERGYVLNEQEKTVTYPPEGTGEAPLSAEDQIIIMRVVPVLQLLDLLNQGEFFAEDIEKQFDLVVMMIQQITETLRRAVVGPVDQTDSGEAYQTFEPCYSVYCFHPGGQLRLTQEKQRGGDRNGKKGRSKKGTRRKDHLFLLQAL